MTNAAKTYTLINDQTSEAIETINAEGFALWLTAPQLLEAAIALSEQIISLIGQSSVIDEDLEMGEPLAALRGAIANATG